MRFSLRLFLLCLASVLVAGEATSINLTYLGGLTLAAAQPTARADLGSSS